MKDLIERIKLFMEALRILPEVYQFYIKYKPLIEASQETNKQYEEFMNEIGSNIEAIGKAAKLITEGYAASVQYASQFPLGHATVADVERELEEVTSALKATAIAPAIGSMEINRKMDTIGALEERQVALMKKKEELNNVVTNGTNG